MPQPTFNQFPISYRLAQGGLLLVILSLINFKFVFKPLIPWPIRLAAGILLAGTSAIALVAGYYVIIRYPFLSLVEASDGDKFALHFQSANGRVYFWVKLLSTIVVTIFLGTIIAMGLDNVRHISMFFYVAISLSFLVFFTFFYDPVRHPTISTFIRVTLGLGILLFPFFLPAIAIGSRRCRRLLNSVGDQ